MDFLSEGFGDTALTGRSQKPTPKTTLKMNGFVAGPSAAIVCRVSSGTLTETEDCKGRYRAVTKNKSRIRKTDSTRTERRARMLAAKIVGATTTEIARQEGLNRNWV